MLTPHLVGILFASALRVPTKDIVSPEFWEAYHAWAWEYVLDHDVAPLRREENWFSALVDFE